MAAAALSLLRTPTPFAPGILQLYQQLDVKISKERDGMPRPFEVAARSKKCAGREIKTELKSEATSLAVQLLSRAPREPFERTALDRWSQRLGAGARHAAATLAGKLDVLRASTGDMDVDIRRFMTGGHTPSALDVPPTAWLRVTETQITRPLASFINEGAPQRALAFLRALPCTGVELPVSFDSGNASAEVPADGGRVDLLVTGRSGGRTYGAAVEVKIDHSLHNPLGSYARVAEKEGLAIPGRSKLRATGALVVLGRHPSEAIRKRLSRNRGWRFVHWSGFLRRFERELAHATDDDDFRAFRRMVWDRFI